MARAVKEEKVAELTERFQNSSGAVLTEYRGLTVAQVKELRQSLGEDATFSVVKNTLTKIAAKDAGITADFTQMLVGPSAIAFVGGDVVQAAKGLRDFSRANPLLVIKGGVLDGKIMTPAEITKLADLESRDVLLAKLAGAMKATMSGAAATFAALPVQMARLLAALEAKKAAEGPAAGADAPVADAPVADAPVADAPVADAPVADAQAAPAAQDAKPTAEAAEQASSPAAGTGNGETTTTGDSE
jgi:large subunit ribosomal protein L10